MFDSVSSTGTMTVTAPEPDLQRIHDVLVGLARSAGKMILNAHPKVAGVGNKKNSTDLVTETDTAVEKMVSETLRAEFPSYEFLGEETYTPGRRLTDAPTFICDPIDGTINFVHQFPNVCISLGFSTKKQPKVGVIYNPFSNKLYTAITGRGSFLRHNDGPPQRLPLSPSPEPLTELSNALVAVEWGAHRSGNNWEVKFETFKRLAMSKDQGGSMVHSLRCNGSCALNLCAVAEGCLDVFWEGGVWAWDVAAGMVILREAGGKVVDGNPGNWDPPVDGRTYLAVRGAPSGQNGIIEEFWSQVQGRLKYSFGEEEIRGPTSKKP